MARSTNFVALVCALTFLSGCSSVQTTTSGGVRPNVLLIVADDLGFSDLGQYGGEIETPSLDRLAENGVRLTQFYTTGRCCPSRASILTGQYPHRVGLGHMTQDIGRPGYRGALSEDAITIAQALGEAGYRSFISGKWHLGVPDPTRHGFEEFYGTLVSARSFWDPERYLRLPEGRPAREYPPGEFYGTDALTDHAIEFIDLARETPDQPWFLYLAYNAPHFPLHAPKELVEKYVGMYEKGWDVLRVERLERMKTLGLLDEGTELTPRSPWWNYGETAVGMNPAWDSLPEGRRRDLARRMAIFAAMVDRMDHGIGRIVANLEDNQELDNTLVLFLSDNGACAEWDPNGFDARSSNNNVLHTGEKLGGMGGPDSYHSVGSGWANLSNTPWRFYKHFNHEGGISTPMIVHWPAGLSDSGAILSAPGHIVDLAPTLLDAADADYPPIFNGRETIPLPGQSLLPLLTGSATEERTLFFEHEGHRAVRQGRYKLVARRGRDWELYDIDEDRTELNDLASRQPDRVARMAEAWETWAAENYVTPLPDDYRVDYVPAGKPSANP